MYCWKCGTKNDNDAVFCKRCSSRLVSAETDGSRSRIDISIPKPQITLPKLPKKALLGAAAAAVAVLVIVAVSLIAGKTAGKSHEKLVGRYLDAGYSQDVEKFFDLFPEKLTDIAYKQSGVTKAEFTEYYSDRMDGFAASRIPGYPYTIDAKYSYTAEITEDYDYDDYELERIQHGYDNAGVDVKIKAAKSLTYSVRLTADGKERDLGSYYKLSLIQIGKKWYINDYYQDSIFFYSHDTVLRDFTEIYRETREKKDSALVAAYLGCTTDNLLPLYEQLEDGRDNVLFRYVFNNGDGSSFRLYWDGNEKNGRVMAYYPWSIISPYAGSSIPAEQIPSDERDNSWKINFADSASSTSAPTGGTISAYPDGDESKVPVIYNPDLDLSWEKEKALAKKQKPELIKYLGCTEDELWIAYTDCEQKGKPRAGFWYVKDFNEISYYRIILLEDGAAAWVYDDTIIWDGDEPRGYLTVETIEPNALKSEPKEMEINAKKLSDAKQKAMIAEYMGWDEKDMKRYGKNEAGRLDFENSADDYFGLVFLLDDGTVAAHREGEPPYRVDSLDKQTDTVPFSALPGLEGVTVQADGHGPWFLTIEFGPDGSFTGDYTAYTENTYLYGTDNGYPTAEYSTFHGSFQYLVKQDDYTYIMDMASLEFDVPIGTEEIIDGTRYIYAAPWSLDIGHTYTLYLPGHPTEHLPDMVMFQYHRQGGTFSSPDPDTLPCWCLYVTEPDAAFSEIT